MKGSEDITPERRPYFPTYGWTFPLWMCNEVICAEFIRLFAMDGQPVTLLAKPKTEQSINTGKGIRSVRFDVVAETQDYHIYCVDSQRIFKQESYSDRTLYYGCMAMATKSLREKEDFDQLRPVTVIFIYIDNVASKESIDVMNIYKRRDVENISTPQPYNDKLTFIDINLNNKANCNLESTLDSDIRAFMDLMSNGDDEHLVKMILSDENLSDSMRKVIQIFRGLMNDVIRKAPIQENEDADYLDEILRREEYTMTTGELIRHKALLEGKIEIYYTVVKLKPHEIAKELKIDESEVNRILKDLKLLDASATAS